MDKIEKSPSDLSHPIKILFMGTPDFALECLKKIWAHKCSDVIGVVTQPDKKKGRGMKLLPPPVKVFAEEKNIPVFQPETLRGPDFENTFKELSPELVIVAAYGKKLPLYILDYPKYGCVNAHASLLPKYRGAAPINRAIMNGEKKTGITAMYMAEGIDTGDIITKLETEITPDDNAETLHDRLASMSGTAMCSVIDMIQSGKITREKQPEEGVTYADKITREDCKIDFNRKPEEILNLIRGLSPYPCAFTNTPDGRVLKVTQAAVGDEPCDMTPGKVTSLSDGTISVSCGGGIIKLSEVIPEGKSKMSAADYIRGRKISEGDVLG